MLDLKLATSEDLLHTGVRSIKLAVGDVIDFYAPVYYIDRNLPVIYVEACVNGVRKQIPLSIFRMCGVDYSDFVSKINKDTRSMIDCANNYKFANLVDGRSIRVIDFIEADTPLYNYRGDSRCVQKDDYGNIVTISKKYPVFEFIIR